MAGYIFNLDSIASLEKYTRRGIYSTKLSPSVKGWKKHHEATLADYATMKEGDNVFFFIRRKIYGIGELVDVGGGCKYSNFPGAGRPGAVDYGSVRDILLWDEGDFSVNQRWVCLFRPSPAFFMHGVDMDDVLASNPSAFKMLKAFWKVSFIKFDDRENQAFKDILLKSNARALSEPVGGENVFESAYADTHGFIAEKLKWKGYGLNPAEMLRACAEGDCLRHEMAIEAGLLYQLGCKDRRTESIFGSWDYLSHQVIASPFKPIDYMDKMDLFGFAYLPGYSPTRAFYFVGEIKKDGAMREDVEQLLKYVDWVRDEYAFGDYSMIRAFLIAYDFDGKVIDYAREAGSRKYIIGRRPARSCDWRNLELVKYCFRGSEGRLDFEKVTGGF